MTTMKKQELTLAGVPAILYGERSRKVYLYVHGKNGCKEEAERFANTACAAGWQVLAIDLPEHGARKDRPEQLLPWAVVPEIQAVYARMQPVWPHIRLYGVSIGAWLAMQALRAEKLEKALREARLDVRGLTALDVGASTGGFTDCLLQHGAAEVFSVDVGHDQLHPSLRQDTRVHSLEGTDIRRTECMMELLGGRRPDFCTVDVSFISLEQVGSAVFSLLSPAAPVVWLIKPQFEAGRGAVGKKGIVRQKSDHVRVLEKACAFFYSQGYGVCWLSHSPIRGGEGNVEYLTVLRKNDAEETIRTTVDEVVEKAWRELGGRG